VGEPAGPRRRGLASDEATKRDAVSPNVAADPSLAVAPSAAPPSIDERGPHESGWGGPATMVVLARTALAACSRARSGTDKL